MANTCLLNFSSFLSQACITFIISRKIKHYALKSLTNKDQRWTWQVGCGPRAKGSEWALSVSGPALCTPFSDMRWWRHSERQGGLQVTVTLRGVASGGTCPFWMQLEGVCTVTWTKQFPRIWGGPSWSGEFSHLCEHWGDIFIVRACLVTSVLSDSLWPMDYSPPDSSVHGILQARILELFAMPSSRGSSQPRDHTQAWYWQAGSWPLVPPGKHMFRVGIQLFTLKPLF